MTTRILYLLFFLSGACALIYENLWFKILRLIFGNTTYALSTVLASFMAGLALGSWLFGKYIDSSTPKASKEPCSSTLGALKRFFDTRNPVVVYGLLEIAIGVLCLGTIFLKDIIESLYLSLYRTLHPPLYGLILIRFVLSFLLLVIPTMCMGGTLPVLSKFFIHRLKAVGRDVAVLYSLNTLGACTGVLVSGFILFPNMGIQRILILTSLTNVVIGVISLFIARLYRPPEQIPEEESTPENTSGFSRSGILLLIGFGLSGVVSMVYEISWTRILAMLIGSSAYAFSIMLATFLLGLVIGSIIFKQIHARFPVRLRSFGILQILIAASVAAFLPFIQEIPFLFLQLYRLIHGQYYVFQASTFLLCALVMFVPTVLIGMTFPLVSQLYANKKEELGGQIGRVYAINTIGNIVGALIGGFLLIPLLGIHKTMIIGVSINCVVGLMVWLGEKDRLGKGAYAGAVVFCLIVVSGISVYPWPKKILISGVPVSLEKWLSIKNKKQIDDRLHYRNLLYFKDGLNCTVSVNKTSIFTYLKVNGKTDASTTISDMSTQTLCGYLPLLFVKDPKDVFIVGLGSGVTAASCADFPSVRRIDVAEIEAAVVEGAAYFSEANRDVLHNPRVNIHIEDGRNYLLREGMLYDVIISEPSNPWIEGVASLFTREYYRMMHQRLKPGGVVCQWVQLYGMGIGDIRRVIKTFRSVFPHVSIWEGNDSDLLILGSDRALSMDIASLRSQYKNNKAFNKELRTLGFMTSLSLISAFVFDERQAEIISAPSTINTDDYNILEYSSPRMMYEKTSLYNRAVLKNHWSPRDSLLNGTETFSLDTSAKRLSYVRTYLRREDLERAEFELQNLKKEFPEIADIYYYDAVVSHRHKKYDDAIAALKKALQYSEDPRYYYYLGFVYEKKNAYAEAEAMLRKAIALRPQEPEYYIFLVGMFKMRNKCADALEILKQALQYHPYHTSLNLLYDSCRRRLLREMNQKK